jgi:TrkA domain protein
MARIEQTRLPGVGVRHDFVTRDGRRVGVITRHSGRRELLVYDDADPDRCLQTLHLDEADSQALVELLGGSHVTEMVADVQQRVEGLAIDWLSVEPGWFADGVTIADTQLRRRTGVSIVAILRGDDTIPSPEPSQSLLADDTVVVVGTPAGIEAASVILRVG